VAWAALGILVVTGLAGLVQRGMSNPAGAMWAQPFGRILAVKLALVLPVLVLGAFHDFAIGPRAAALRRAGDPRAPRLGKTVSWLARLSMLLTVAIVTLAIVMVRTS
jgi:putative copper export protein